MAKDYLPDPDAELLVWAQRFLGYANANAAALGLGGDDLPAVQAAVGAAIDTFTANSNAQNAAQSARRAKDTARDALERTLRTLVRRLQANPALSDAQKQGLGITVGGDAPDRPAATRPVLSVDSGERLRHTLQFRDAATPDSRAKPDGVIGCEIWVKIGDAPPADPGECRLLALDTASPYVAVFSGEDAGKTAHYLARWQSTRGEPGPWSDSASATIPGLG